MPTREATNPFSSPKKSFMKTLTPSMGSSPKEAAIVVTGEKNCPVTLTPATETVSVKMGPSTKLPSPYSILKFPFCFLLLEDLEGSNLVFFAQAAPLQPTPATHRSEEPAREKV